MLELVEKIKINLGRRAESTDAWVQMCIPVGISLVWGRGTLVIGFVWPGN